MQPMPIPAARPIATKKPSVRPAAKSMVTSIPPTTVPPAERVAGRRQGALAGVFLLQCHHKQSRARRRQGHLQGQGSLYDLRRRIRRAGRTQLYRESRRTIPEIRRHLHGKGGLLQVLLCLPREGTETFETGNALGHDWGEWQSNGNGTHTHVCKTDESHTETVSCPAARPPARRKLSARIARRNTAIWQHIISRRKSWMQST